MNSGRDKADEDEDKLREKKTERFIKAQVKEYEDEPSLRSIIAFAHTLIRIALVMSLTGFRSDLTERMSKLSWFIEMKQPPTKRAIASLTDMPMDEAVPPTKLTVLNGRLLTQ
jgi:hypothetical protein